MNGTLRKSRIGTLWALTLVLATFIAVAQPVLGNGLGEDGRSQVALEGSFGAVVAAPTFSVDTWLDLALCFAGFGLESLTSFTLDPGLAGEQRFRAMYGWEWLELGTTVEISLVPYALHAGDVYLDLTLADVASEDPFLQTLFALVSFELSWFPALAPSIEADVRTTLGPLSTSLFGRVGVVPFSWQEGWFEIVVSFLQAAIGDQTQALLTGDLTARIDLAPTLGTSLLLALGCQIDALTARTLTEVALYPALAASEDLIATVDIDAWTFTASTRVNLLPYGIEEQRIAAMYAGKHFEAHAAVIFGPSAGAVEAGFEVSFP